MGISNEQAYNICQELVGRKPDAIDRPGGESRDSLRAHFGDQSLFVTFREEQKRAQLEALALRVMNQHGAPAPRLIAFRDHYLIQQDMGQQRLSQALDEADEEQLGVWLRKALLSLVDIQSAGHKGGLGKILVTLGEKPQWLNKLMGRPDNVGRLLGLNCPDFSRDEVAHLLRVREPRFIKWDARPGNAVLHDNGRVYWIDWEHCGCRNPLDDMAWLLVDEYTPTARDLEEQLIEDHIALFSEGWEQREALDYLYTYGVLHASVRLSYILSYQSDGGWWDRKRCLATDKVGVTEEFALRLARRAGAWAGQSTLLKPLADWFTKVQEGILRLDQH